MTLEQYLNMRIEWYENALQQSELLEDSAIGKQIYIAKERECLSLLNDIKSFIKYLDNNNE